MDHGSSQQEYLLFQIFSHMRIALEMTVLEHWFKLETFKTYKYLPKNKIHCSNIFVVFLDKNISSRHRIAFLQNITFCIDLESSLCLGQASLAEAALLLTSAH